jgi:ATP-dependent Lon protease
MRITTDSPADPSASVTELIGKGESRSLEFKSTFRLNLATGQRDVAMEQTVVKTVAGFLNSHGVTLLISVADDGSILGLADDFVAAGNKGRDGYANLLTTVLDASLGRAAVTNVSITIDGIDGKDVCRVDVTKGHDPTFVRNTKGDADLYVRINNSTRLLNSQDAMQYARKHWR